MSEKFGKKILFFVNDFKTDLWGAELKKFNYEVMQRENRFLSHIKILLTGYFKRERIDAFIFRYLNDHKSLNHSILYLLRDILIIFVCKLLGTKILWILHNIDRETKQYHPRLIAFRRKIIHFASKKVMVTDPNLQEVAAENGIVSKKIDWLCFGIPDCVPQNRKNVELKNRITFFKNQLQKSGEIVRIGLCVSGPARKKLHYLLADTIVGKSSKIPNKVVGLVFIGNFPVGPKFDLAKKRIQESPYILFIDDSFEVNESYISEQIDFYYRSLSDLSVPYTVYVAANERKPIVTHNFGALPLLIKKERLGFIVDIDEKEIQAKISDYVGSWSSKSADQFLEDRTWTIAATRLIRAIEG